MWKYCEICCISIIIYIKGKKKVQTEGWKKKTVAIVQNIKKEVAHQNITVDEQWNTLNE